MTWYLMTRYDDISMEKYHLEDQELSLARLRSLNLDESKIKFDKIFEDYLRIIKEPSLV